MLTISEFAQACGLSVPALRRYAEAGVLVPAEVDERTGHRRYAPGQISDGVLVHAAGTGAIAVALLQGRRRPA